jgi:hypothetical protein
MIRTFRQFVGHKNRILGTVVGKIEPNILLLDYPVYGESTDKVRTIEITWLGQAVGNKNIKRNSLYLWPWSTFLSVI